MWWWVWGALVVVLLVAYLTWLGGRVGRLHRRVEAAGAALDATLVRRAAAAAVLAEELATAQPRVSADLYAAARAALDADPGEREAAESDLTHALRRLPDLCAPHPDSADGTPYRGGGGFDGPAGDGPAGDRPARDGPAGDGPAGDGPAWPNVVTASRRVGLARQVHTDVVRDALAVRRRVPVRALGLARRHGEPAYFDVDPDIL